MRVFVGLSVLSALLLHLQLVKGSFVETNFFSSCTGIQSVLPNLSYAKAVNTITGTTHGTCNQSGVNVRVVGQVTWNYYATYPPTCNYEGNTPEEQCCHSTGTSTLNITSQTYDENPVSEIQTGTGIVSAGPFEGASVTRIVTMPNPNAQCASPLGAEARSGTISLTITNTFPLINLVCTGVVTQEMCPGLRLSLWALGFESVSNGEAVEIRFKPENILD